MNSNCVNEEERNDQVQLISHVEIVEPQNYLNELSSGELISCSSELNLNVESIEEMVLRKNETHIPKIKVKPLRDLQDSQVQNFEPDDCLSEFLNLPPYLSTKNLEGIKFKCFSNKSHLNSDSPQVMLDKDVQLSVYNKKESVSGINERIFENYEERTIWVSGEIPSQHSINFLSNPVIVETEEPSTDSNLLAIKSVNVNNYSDLNFDIFHSDRKNCEINNQENVECFVDNDIIDLTKELEVENVDMTDLKNGIIEASRTLINTQKMLKVLSKVTLKQEMLKTHHIFTALTKFKKLLNVFQDNISKIDKTVRNQYKDLFPKYDIDSLLQSINKPTKPKVKRMYKKSIKPRNRKH